MAVEPNSSSGHATLWRFTLKHLFIWTAIIAASCVALRSANGLWAAVMLGLASLTMAAAILLVIFRQGAGRAYWIGFATFGWLYLLLVLFGWNIEPTSTHGDNPFRPHNLVTSRLSDAAYHWLYDDAFATYYQSLQTAAGGGYSGFGSSSGMPMGPGGPYGSGGMSMMGGGMMSGGGYSGSGMGGPAAPPPPPPGPHAQDFTNVSQALWAILLAAIGGALAHWLYATRPGERTTPAERGGQAS